MIIFSNWPRLLVFLVTGVLARPQYSLDYDQVRATELAPDNSPQYQELDRQYRGQLAGRRQDVLQGQFVDVMQAQQEEEAELVDAPVPVVIRGEVS